MRTIRSLLVLVVLFFSAQAVAAPPITSGQWASFRAAVKAHNADAIATAYAAKNPDTLVTLYNAPSGTSIWRTAVTPAELVGSIIMSEFLGFQANGDQKRSAMLMLVQLGTGGLDATNSNVRDSFVTIWTGTTTLTNLTTVARRNATVFEAIAAYLTAAAPANVCAPEIYGHVLTRLEVATALWDDAGNPL